MAVHHNWAPLHLERTCSAIEQLPESVRSAELGQIQPAKDLGDSGLSRDLAGSAEWTPSHRGSEGVSSSHNGSADILPDNNREYVDQISDIATTQKLCLFQLPY
ncbi:hypothetical protein BDV10DRAFT_186161 [Aspergillus recurvatus]